MNTSLNYRSFEASTGAFAADSAGPDDRSHRSIAARRQRFEAEPVLNLTPIEEIVLPVKSRNEGLKRQLGRRPALRSIHGEARSLAHDALFTS